MITCTRRVQFCCGHRVAGHEGKCAKLHGHNYVAEITVSAPELDEIGRTIDFSVVKTAAMKLTENEWDHRTLIHAEDPIFSRMAQRINEPEIGIVRVPFNPTAENMAAFMMERITELIHEEGDQFNPVEVVRVRLYETENCWAEASREHSYETHGKWEYGPRKVADGDIYRHG